ncbi:hypothetical protein [Candidatus Nitrotoga sp. BS]|uniref:hypothetical protein n=1 Tax=Candidatus Nitrotoga sp. BS TaxID=2890408 RepID=UPI001EF1AB43|nr:hypothetical protein [Candidatus Nitrotoga sp. BS]
MMSASNYKKTKLLMINALGVASLVLFSNSTVSAKEPSTIAGGDLGSGRIKAETAKPIKKPSAISSGDLGSGRIKAEKEKPNKPTK